MDLYLRLYSHVVDRYFLFSFLVFKQCLTKNPLAYYQTFQSQVSSFRKEVTDLATTLGNDTVTIHLLSEQCGIDVSSLPSTLNGLSDQLAIVDGNLLAVIDLTACQHISPIVRRITMGSLCTESVYGLTVIWSCLLSMCILCFVLLTTRAALFNSVKIRETKTKSERKRKLKQKKEFEEYKLYMAKFYDGTDQWIMVPPKKKKAIEIEVGSAIQANPTFETEPDTPDSEDIYFDDSVSGQNENTNTSDNEEGFDNDDDDDDDDDSSWSSSDESEEDDDEKSGLSSFFTETASFLAYQTIQAIRHLPTLLGAHGDVESSSHEFEDDTNPNFDSPFKESEEGATMEATSEETSEFCTPTSAGVPFFDGSRILALLTPMAPRKVIGYLRRTRLDEMEPLTPSHPPLLSPAESDIQPRQLVLLSPSESRGKASPTTPSSNHDRPRKFSFGDLEDISLESEVLVVAPRRPNKPHNRFSRMGNAFRS